MAKRFTKPAINWIELEKRVPPEQKNNFFAFKGKSDGYLRRVQANPPEPPKINWDEYQKTVPVAGLVDKFKKEYEAFKVPFPQDTLSSKVDEQWKALEPQIKTYCAGLQKDIDEAQKQLQSVKSIPPFESMTMETVCDLFPEQALDSVNNPTFWPHTPEEQEGYIPPEQKAAVKEKK